jgi:cell division protein FtsB
MSKNLGWCDIREIFKIDRKIGKLQLKLWLKRAKFKKIKKIKQKIKTYQAKLDKLVKRKLELETKVRLSE